MTISGLVVRRHSVPFLRRTQPNAIRHGSMRASDRSRTLAPVRWESYGWEAIRSEPAEGRSVMDRVCLVLPILPEKTADARAFQEELDGPRKSEYAASERTIGIDKEVWFIASAPTGDQLVAYMESPDFNKSLGMFVQSREDFDMWFKERLANVTGVDLNAPPPMTLPEVVSTYEA